jgi:hypothetical protein
MSRLHVSKFFLERSDLELKPINFYVGNMNGFLAILAVENFPDLSAFAPRTTWRRIEDFFFPRTVIRNVSCGKHLMACEADNINLKPLSIARWTTLNIWNVV